MEDIRCILLDIGLFNRARLNFPWGANEFVEGTICPISFVKDTLFPYALKALPDVLASKWDDEEFKAYRDAFPEAAKKSPEKLQAYVEDLTKRDVKIASLKNLQGYLWENGYKTGAYSTPLFSDVAPQLKQWKHDGFHLAIYSSGSVFAQKLLFGHVNIEAGATGQKRKRKNEANHEGLEQAPPKKTKNSSTENQATENSSMVSRSERSENKNADVSKTNAHTTEDLQHLITDWFDTTNAGLKTEAASYEKIAAILKWSTKDVLFLSDNVKEVDAAVDAGMHSIMVDRPGNAPLSDLDRDRLSIVHSLDEIELAQSRNPSKMKSPRSGKTIQRQSQRLKAKASVGK